MLHYLDHLDATRHTIGFRDGEDVLKVCAKIIIGRDSAEQRQALRQLNGHLHRVEILTYDHLLRIAERVVKSLEQALPADEGAL